MTKQRSGAQKGSILNQFKFFFGQYGPEVQKQAEN